MLLFAVVILVLLIDQASKIFIRNSIPVGDSVAVIPGILHITHVRNPGAAFGLLPNQHIFFLIISISVIIFVLYYYWRARVTDKILAVALGLVCGGAAGNLIDRIASGRVTDFVDFRVWPVFNVADSAIVIGVVLISYVLLRTNKQSIPQERIVKGG